MTRARPRVAVLHNAPVLEPGHPDAASESDVVAVARVVTESLARQGYEAVAVAAGPPVDGLLPALRAAAPDVVFNLIEGFGGSSVGANVVTGLLEMAGFSITGCPADALTWCLSKGRAKALLRGLGLPTAPFAIVEPGVPIPRWEGPWPVIVKPDAEDGSLGIDQASVVDDPASLADRVGHVSSRYGDRVLIEAYLPGREFNVGILALPGPEALPIAEVAFRGRDGARPILTYDAKWSEGSDDDRSSPVRCPATIDDGLAGELHRIALAAFRATGCRDYARVDLRLDGRGAPMILEVNPNPDIGPAAGLARALRASGRDYDEMLARLVDQAMRRRDSPGNSRPGRSIDAR